MRVSFEVNETQARPGTGFALREKEEKSVFRNPDLSTEWTPSRERG
jgi:hypothetical protein